MKMIRHLGTIASLFGVILVVAGGVVACSKEASVDLGYIETESQTYETLVVSDAKKFSLEDLVVNNLNMGMSEEQVKSILGEPVNYYESKNQELDEKVYSYNELSLVFIKVGETYKLCTAASLNDSDVFARGIKVGDSKEQIFKLFYRDENCMNNNVMSGDNQTIIGKYLYGEYTIDNLDVMKIKDNIEYGIINYNGYSSFEEAQSYIIEFTYFEPPYKGENATYYDDFAQIAFDIDDKGIISGIRWYYYPEVNE